MVLYNKAPIIEAVIELRFATPLGEGPFKKISDVLRKKYLSGLDQKIVDIQVNMDTGLAEAENPRPSLRLTNSDQTDILILQLDRISWSRLPPYEGWEAFVARVEQELRLITKLVGERTPERFGVRYINRIDVPPQSDGILRYEDYIAINIGLPPMLDPLVGYQWRIDRVFPERNASAMIQSAIMVPEVPGTGAFLLDIDAYATEDLPNKVDGLIKRLSDLRLLKNELFELAITPLARESFL